MVKSRFYQFYTLWRHLVSVCCIKLPNWRYWFDLWHLEWWRPVYTVQWSLYILDYQYYDTIVVTVAQWLGSLSVKDYKFKSQQG